MEQCPGKPQGRPPKFPPSQSTDPEEARGDLNQTGRHLPDSPFTRWAEQGPSHRPPPSRPGARDRRPSPQALPRWGQTEGRSGPSPHSSLLQKPPRPLSPGGVLSHTRTRVLRALNWGPGRSRRGTAILPRNTPAQNLAHSSSAVSNSSSPHLGFLGKNVGIICVSFSTSFYR